MSIGENIKYYRKKSNLTQCELAKKTNLSRSFISKIEINNKRPSLEMLIKISKALGVDVKDLDSNITLWEDFKTQPIMSTSSIGNNIKECRTIRKITQQQLADMIVKSLNTIKKYESGYTLPPINVINDIAEALGVSTNELITNEVVDFNDVETSDLKEFINNFEDDFLDISNRNNIIYDKGFLDGLKKALQIIEGEE